jgi:hypothetical protein
LAQTKELVKILLKNEEEEEFSLVVVLFLLVFVFCSVDCFVAYENSKIICSEIVIAGCEFRSEVVSCEGFR